MEDEERIVIFFVVIVCCVVVMVVDVRCESVGCSSVVALATVVVLMRSRGRYCLSESAVHQVAFRGVSFRAILCQIVVLLFSCFQRFTDLFARITEKTLNIYYCQKKVKNVRKF